MKLAAKAPAPKPAAKKPAKEQVKKRRSDKEIALVWLDDKLSKILEASEALTQDELAECADGRKVQEQHIRKIQSLVNKRIEAYRKPILRLFKIRGIE
jgi:hypothetical protein